MPLTADPQRLELSNLLIRKLHFSKPSRDPSQPDRFLQSAVVPPWFEQDPIHIKYEEIHLEP